MIVPEPIAVNLLNEQLKLDPKLSAIAKEGKKKGNKGEKGKMGKNKKNTALPRVEVIRNKKARVTNLNKVGLKSMIYFKCKHLALSQGLLR